MRSPRNRSKFSSPIDELTFLLNRLESRIAQARNDYRDHLEKPESAVEESPEKPSGRLSRFGFGRRQEKANENHTPKKNQSQHSMLSDTSSTKLKDKPDIKFISIPNQAEVIEDLRRVAELVVIGENYVTSLQKKEEKEFQRQKEAWGSLRDMIDEPEEKEKGKKKKEEQSEEYAQIFDLFFERNALEMIINLLTGVSFDLSLFPRSNDDEEEKNNEEKESNEEEESNAEKESNEKKEGNEEEEDGEVAEIEDAESDKESAADGDTPQPVKRKEAPLHDDDTLLPPLAVATQAVQSISILIQNVSRATSLYVILSNNHVNELIDLPLKLYSAAERNRQREAGEEATSRTFSSPELAELTTHFVTFLKSLAMRMNAETLQFFLKYPSETGEAGDALPVSSSHFIQDATEDPLEGGDLPSLSKSEPGPRTPANRSAPLKVEFPLYERALEFCAAHQDSFVRVTAMNICLNTLRLTTVSSPDEEDTSEEDDPSPSSPDGVLHHARPLPFRERLAIAQHTCAPSRVERLIAPIFTKLAERWNALDDQIREIDIVKGMTVAEGGDLARSRNEKVAKAKEKVRRERMIRTFKDKAADLQDELLLLEDVFKVGLTVLNEQMIEMMFATFVYPMLLQPLLLFYQRFTSTVDTSRDSFAENPFGGYSGDYSDAESILAPVAAPAKAALFTIASIFNLLSNRPLLRLLYTSLFHPLSPDSSSVPTVRSTLEVAASVGRKGRKVIRLDEPASNEHPIPDHRDTYAFGTTPGNRRLSKMKAPSLEALEGTEACVFVLAPALAEVLEFRGDDVALITRTRPNPYRRAILQCLDVPDEMSDVRKLSVCTFDAALTIFDGKFASDILFGVDLKSFADDMPADERNLDSAEAHLDDDRDIGGGGVYESRQALGRQKGGSVGSDLTGEVVSALCGSTIVASKMGPGAWRLCFDDIATHALLSAVRKNGRALSSASKSTEIRWRQAAAFMAERPNVMLSPMGGSSIDLAGSPSVNAENYDELMYGGIANVMFFDAPEAPKKTIMPCEEFVEIMDRSKKPKLKGLSVHISTESNFDLTCNRVGEVLLADVETNSEDQQELQLSRTSAKAFLKLDALLSLLKDLGATGGIKVHKIDLSGIAFSSDGSIVDMIESSVTELTRQIYAPISSGLTDVIFSDRNEDEEVLMPESGSIIALAGSPAIPCVCEAPETAAHLFIDAGTGVVAEGVTWQSLYLVFQNGHLVFAQPHAGGSGGDGRVIAACPLERLLVGQDTAPPVSPARRLFLSHKSFDTTPPPLFLFDDLPEQEEYGPFLRVKPFVSSLDVWFEDQRAVDQAFQIISVQIFGAKAQRGRRLLEYLSPEKETKGFHW